MSSLQIPGSATAGTSRLDVEALRAQFPTLSQEVHGYPLVYLDSAATTQKPRCVLAAMDDYYARDNANVHRGVHLLSQRATEAFEEVRPKVQHFLGAPEEREIIFTRGTTEAINLVASSFGQLRVRAGDEIVVTQMEHHSNIVPWLLLSKCSGAKLRVAPIHDNGELDLDGLEALLGPRTRLVAVAHASNVLGTINPVQEVARMAHEHGAAVLVDGAQGAPHLPVDVRELGCDFYAFSAHKAYGPTGAGVLWGRAELLEEMPPWQGGGDMILTVSFEETTFKEIPYKFEAGTPNIAAVIGMGAAIDFLEEVGIDAIQAHERELLDYATGRLEEIDGLRIIGTARRKLGAISFVIAGLHPHDVGTILDRHGVAIRTGHHCAQPLMKRLALPATSRASLGLYNNRADIDRLVQALGEAKEVFAL